MPEQTEHFQYRAAQRNVSEDAVDYVLTYGQCHHKAGAVIYYLRNIDIPWWDRMNDDRVRLVGTAVILTRDQEVFKTTWRNRQKGLKRIKRKPDHSSWSNKELYE